MTSTVKTPDLSEERLLYAQGHSWVVGLDEVGRGAWAGPVTVGAALMHKGVSDASMPRWLRDSKQLSERRREAIFDEVGQWCAEWSVGHATPEECDAWGMTEALRLAAQRALAGLAQQPDALIVDGPINLLRAREGEESPSPTAVRTIPGGDARCASVAAASVLAKVVRDRLMRQEADHFPAYAFERNKGYPSPVHQMALRGYGLSAIHRRSWSYVDGLPWSDRRTIGQKSGLDQV
jgi:ribonuclease HII